jgi:serine/threonine protein kinase
MTSEKHGPGDGDSTHGDETEFLNRSATTRPSVLNRTGDPVSSSRYLIGETLGEGGMAVVHLATDTDLGRQVAVKRLRTELSENEEAKERFFSEAQILAGLEHPGTTAVFEAGQFPDGEYFYAMQRVHGRTLRELLDERIPEDLLDRGNRAQFIEIFIRACQAVGAAHKQGVIHRDLKPDNIMVDDLGVVYVMDWGLAKQLVEDEDGQQSDSNRTQLGAVMGTPAYMAPEQASGHAGTSDRQADVFSLGVMLYEIITGVNPFRGETAVESMKGVMYHDPETPRKHNPRVDRTISAITMKALDKDPFKRYRSAVELAEDVRRYREFRPVSAREPSLPERLVNWSRRHPRLAASAATLVVVVMVGLLLAAVQTSVEQARIHRGHEIIDQVESRLKKIQTEMDTLEAGRADASNDADLRAINRKLTELQAEFEAGQSDRRNLALAITGFTILSPDERATKIVRDSMLDEIREHLETGDLYRARAQIRTTRRYAEVGNAFGFSQEDRDLLAEKLAEVERQIENEQPRERPE